MVTGQITKGVSQLPVAEGMEAEAINREIMPLLRELVIAVRAMGQLVDDLEQRVIHLEYILEGP